MSRRSSTEGRGSLRSPGRSRGVAPEDSGKEEQGTRRANSINGSGITPNTTVTARQTPMATAVAVGTGTRFPGPSSSSSVVAGTSSGSTNHRLVRLDHHHGPGPSRRLESEDVLVDEQFGVDPGLGGRWCARCPPRGGPPRGRPSPAGSRPRGLPPGRTRRRPSLHPRRLYRPRRKGGVHEHGHPEGEEGGQGGRDHGDDGQGHQWRRRRRDHLQLGQEAGRERDPRPGPAAGRQERASSGWCWARPR